MRIYRDEIAVRDGLSDEVLGIIEDEIDKQLENRKCVTEQASMDCLIELERTDWFRLEDQNHADKLRNEGLWDNNGLTPRGKRMVNHRIIRKKKQNKGGRASLPQSYSKM
jgi:hypothetical protein